MAPTQLFGEISCVDINSKVVATLEKTKFSSTVVASDNCISSPGNAFLNGSTNRNIPTDCQTISDTSQKADSISKPTCINNKEKDITYEVSENLFSKEEYSSAFSSRLRNKRRRRRRRVNCDSGKFNNNFNCLQNVHNCSFQSNTNDNNNTFIENCASCGLQSASENSPVISSKLDWGLSPSQNKSSSPSNSVGESVSPRNSENENCEVIEIGISQKTQPIQNVPMLLIKRRTRRFMDDPFFEEAREHLEVVAREVLDRFGQKSDHNDYLKAYRKLRVVNNDVKEAVVIFQSNETHTVVLDAHDFAKGSLVIKMVKEDELEVEGLIRKMSTGSPGIGIHYQKCFRFPEPVTSANAFASADGVIYITIPKREQIESHPELIQIECISQSKSPSTDHGSSGNSTLLNSIVSSESISTSGTNKMSESKEGTS